MHRVMTVKQVFKIRCYRCNAVNALPTGDDCSRCGATLGLFAQLETLVVNDDGTPGARWSRAISDDEISVMSRDPFQLFQLPK